MRSTCIDVALIGIGCRLPGGVDTPAAFWELLLAGTDAITEVPAERFDAAALFDPDPGAPGALTSCWGGFVGSLDTFDADFFGISPREARRVDPQQRLLLETAWEALEDGGQPADRLAGTDTGVFVGVSTHDYGDMQRSAAQRASIDAYVGTGSALSILANRISYVLDLRGPSLVVDTACSSSLTAVHLACRSLAAGDCDRAIAAGVNVILTPESTIMFSKASMLAPDGRCKPFDARADGYVRSEGAGAVVLKPLANALADADPIYAVIRATGVNEDGRTAGITVPNATAQATLLRRTLDAAGVAACDVQYIEAHGTGTAVGDPQEAAAIGAVYGHDRPVDRPCLTGSVKGNVGHLEAAAGITGLIKTALALRHRQIPPSLHFERGNPAIDFEGLRLRVPTSAQPWPAPPGRALAAVNAFGFGGANAHALLAEAPERRAPTPDEETTARLLPLSARSPDALRALARDWRDVLADASGPSLRDAGHTAALRRSHHPYRLSVVATTRAESVERLDAFLARDPDAGVAVGRVAGADPPRVAFLFSGMGPQWAGMGRTLLHDEPVFRRAVDACDEVLQPLAGWSVVEALTSDDAERITEADRSHVTNLALQLGLAALWRHWGVEPDAVAGHSSGETAAACVAGALSLSEAVRLAYHRGRLLHTRSGAGGMLAAAVAPETVASLVADHDGRVGVAAVNGPESLTLSGDVDALAAIAEALTAQGRWCRELAVRIPYHGPQLDPLELELLASLEGLVGKPTDVPIVSTTTGQWTEGEAFTAAHWWRNLRHPVRFSTAVDRLIDAGCQTFVEVGPHPVLSQSVLECLAGRDLEAVVVPSLRRNEDERQSLARSLGMLYVHGQAVDWAALSHGEGRHVRAPTYPWQRERHWFDAEPDTGPLSVQAAAGGTHPLLGARLRVAQPTWEIGLADPGLDYLGGHVVRGAAAVPGAAYIAMMLAATAATGATGATDEPIGLDGVAFHSLMGLSERDGTVLQTSLDDHAGSLTVSSARDASSAWTLRADARVGEPDEPQARLDLAAIRERCTEAVAPERFYTHAEERFGLSYQGTFRSLVEIRVGGDETLARVVAPGDADLGADTTHVHPALLDAAFHALLAPIMGVDGDRQSAGVVLAGVEHLSCRGRLGSAFWSHTALRTRDGGEIVGEVRLCDDDGNVVLFCRGLRIQALARPDRDRSYVFEEVWEPAPDGQPGTAPAIAAAVRIRLGAFAGEVGFSDYYTVVEPGLNGLARRLIRDALTDLGWHPGQDPRDAPDRLGVAVGHRQYLGRLLELVTGHQLDRALEDGLAGRDDVGPGLELVGETGRRLAATLKGDVDPRDWLLTGDAADALAAFYSTTPSGRFYNRALAEAVAAAKPADRGLRILEVGAGTGATTAALLAELGNAIDAYHFTDVSAFFVKHGRQRFGEHPAMSFAVFDLDDPPDPTEHRYDVVVAADVVHATADVHATLRVMEGLLAPGGLLVLLEPVRRSAWLELIFGQVEGWWGFTDAALRPDHPLLGIADWERALEEAGYGDVASVTDVAPDGGEPMQAILLARPPQDRPAVEATTQVRWLVLADSQGVADRVVATLRSRGDHCTLVRPAEAYRHGPDDAELSPTDETHWAQLMQDAAAGTGESFSVVHCWSLDDPSTNPSDDPPVDPGTGPAESLMAFQDRTSGALVTLLRAASDRDVGIGNVWLITAGAQPARPQDGPPAIAQAPMWGIGRVLRNELGGGDCRLVDLGPTIEPHDVDALLHELTAAPGPHAPEAELVLRGGQRFVRRVRAPAPFAEPRRRRRLQPDSTAIRLAIGSPGALDTLHLREAEPPEVAPGEVVIRAHAASLNFRDVLIALGLMPDIGQPRPLGYDCAGVVIASDDPDVRPGDEVIALGQGLLGSQVVTRADLCAPKPAGTSFQAAAALPTAFVSARIAIHDLGRVAPGERVLIHSASGGVGLAAVQLAQRAGAEVFATAGTPEKRDFLTSVGVEVVMDSRALDFPDEVRDATAGEGVDVVVNTLIGEGRTRSLGLLRPGGRFVDLAVRDFDTDTLDLASFSRGLAYHSFGDPVGPIPASWGHALRAIAREVEAGGLEALPYTTFDLAETDQAFRLLAQARHIGKVVIGMDQPHYWVEQPSSPLFAPDATYLLAGGLGGFGIALASWMVDQGARHLVLTSRRGTPGPEDTEALRMLETSGANVSSVAVDVADADGMRELLDWIRATQPTLKGVVHAAMVLDDEWLGRLDHDRFRAVLAPKVAGAWNLHALTLEDQLDVFVCFSSASSMIGPPTQGGYAAANSFLDTLAAYRRARCRPALTVNWGAISQVGYVARHPELWEVSARAGVEAITPDEAFAALGTALRRTSARVAIGRIDWAPWTGRLKPAREGGFVTTHHPSDASADDHASPQGSATVDLAGLPPEEQSAAAEAHVARRVAAVLDTRPGRIDPTVALTDIGLDSLMAAELRTLLQRDFGIDIPLVDVLDGATVRDLARRITPGVDAPTR